MFPSPGDLPNLGIKLRSPPSIPCDPHGSGSQALLVELHYRVRGLGVLHCARAAASQLPVGPGQRGAGGLETCQSRKSGQLAAPLNPEQERAHGCPSAH